MTITYHTETVQGSDDWLALRRGLITASEMHLLLTPTLKVSANDKSRAHVYELLAQRISGYTEPSYIGSDMLRGMEDEILARALYAEKYSEVRECGFVTNDEWGFTLGYSPDGLIADNGLLECKSRRQKYQVQTIIDGTVPDEYVLQAQTGLLVTKREWLDFTSYCGGLPMARIRVYPDLAVQDAILAAAAVTEGHIAKLMAEYHVGARGLLPTERRVEQEMTV